MRLSCGLVCAMLVAGGCADGHVLAALGEDAGRGDGSPLSCTARCDGVCADLARDPYNCGACGRTCVVSHAEAACTEGECSVGTCEAGWLDCNTDPTDGCEASDSCTPGAMCATACGSTGVLDCTSGCAPVCVPPSETCNGTDDDCNGACDEGAMAGCRRGVHRTSTARGHFYTIDRAEAERSGTVESYDFFWVYTADGGGMSALFRCLKADGTHLYTTDTGCEMQRHEGTVGFVYRSERCGSTPLYRLHNAGSNDHFYTTSAPERDYAVSIGYVDQGIAAWVWAAP